MKRLSALLTSLVVMLNTSCAPLRPHETRLSSVWFPAEVIQNMFEIQAQYDVETVKCLTGSVEGTTVVIKTIEPTWILNADSVSASFKNCNQRNVVGYYHNHPGWIDELGEHHTVCNFSITDYETFYNLKDLSLAVISCDSDILVWMFRNNFRPFIWQGQPTEPQ